MRPKRNAIGSSIEIAQFDGEWIYPRALQVTPRRSTPGFHHLPRAERFRRCAASVTYRCGARKEMRTESQRLSSPQLAP
jgi:hypothetical protein